MSEAHDASGAKWVNLAVIGATGRVGRRLLELVAERAATWAPRLRLVAVGNSRAWCAESEGLAPRDATARLLAAPPTRADALAGLVATLPRPLIVVDCTASAEVAGCYPRWLAAGIELATPNKFGPSADAPLWRALVAAQVSGGTLVRDSGTVGAHLPLLGTLRELRQAGDRVESFEAVLSGTLSFVLGRVQQGTNLSAAVQDAVALGFAEPNPARDLSGEDAARKLVIMSRALGYEIDFADVERVPLVEPAVLDGVEVTQLPNALREADELWRARAAIADARHERWIYRCTFTEGRVRAAPERVAADHPLAKLAPCENALILRSRYYSAAPLTIAGPGAGIDLTATAVLADVLAASRERARSEPAPASRRSEERIVAAA
ncbi:MAG TPA: homoserine dehydrogenase [Rudaea sp.]|nr:homoserine dehydrogenase [Rudaea sp.]